MNLLVRLLITAAVAYGLANIFSGIHFSNFKSAIIFAIVLGILNMFVTPILQLIGLPLTLITLGLFSLVINAVTVLIADYFVDGMKVDGFWWALFFSIALFFITSVVSNLFD